MQQQHFAVDQFVGESAWTERMRKRILQISNYGYSVLISGPSGTGKELVARAVHAHGPRHDKPFIPVNCAAIPSGLFCSQLFGHVKGAFTGAQYAALGCFRAAEGGTIFLDEIGDLDPDSQAKLLRVLQEKMVTPVGSHDDVPVDVRTIAATNRNLAQEVKSGRFRLDLYYRLNVLTVETLGLADRVEDIEPLVSHFLAKTAVESGLPLKTLSHEALEVLEAYEWPGNVRELQNFIERAVVTTEADLIEPQVFVDMFADGGLQAEGPLAGGLIVGSELPDSVPDFMQTDRSSPDGSLLPDMKADDDEWPTLAELEEAYLRRTLTKTYHNQSAAARILGIDRKLLARKVKKYGIEMPARSRRNGQGM
jgi:DNA-binding NtrC family response regulator